jgi:hypothetical protein
MSKDTQAVMVFSFPRVWGFSLAVLPGLRGFTPSNRLFQRFAGGVMSDPSVWARLGLGNGLVHTTLD